MCRKKETKIKSLGLMNSEGSFTYVVDRYVLGINVWKTFVEQMKRLFA